jgi:hypothetical protein
LGAHHHHDHDHGGHGHDHDHAGSRVGDRKRLIGALAVTAVILVAEVVGGFVAHSLALLSDAGHMFSDAVGMALSLAALMIAARPSDARRTYGWHRVEILAALGNGVTLVALSLLIIYEGVRPHPARRARRRPAVMMPIAAIGLVANLIGAWLLHGSHSLNVKGAYLHVLGDTLSSLAVLVGGCRHVLRARPLLARSGAVDRHRPLHHLRLLLADSHRRRRAAWRRCRATSIWPASPTPSTAHESRRRRARSARLDHHQRPARAVGAHRRPRLRRSRRAIS